MRLEVAIKRKFTDLSDRIVNGTTGDPQLERMRAYLIEWSVWRKDQRPKLGTSGNLLARFLKTESPSASDLLDCGEHWIMGLIEAALDDLAAQHDGVLMAASIRCRYLKEGLAGMQIRVIRAGAVCVLGIVEADRLADEGERALIPLCRKRGLLI